MGVIYNPPNQQVFPTIAQDGTGNFEGTTGSTIQDAIDYLEANGGGVLVIKPGTYVVSQKLTVQAADIIIQGSGNSTILQLAGGVNDDLIDFQSDRCKIRDLKIDANGTNQTQGNGVKFTSVNWCRAENVWVSKPCRGGIVMSGCTQTYADDCRCEDNQDATTQAFLFEIDQSTQCGWRKCYASGTAKSNSGGFRVRDSTANNATSKCFMNDCESTSNGIGLLMDSSDQVILGINRIHGNTTGIITSGSANTCEGNILVGNQIVENTDVNLNLTLASSKVVVVANNINAAGAQGVYLQSLNWHAITGNLIWENTTNGVELELCSDVVIDGNVIYNNAGTGVIETTGSNDNTIVGNKLHSNDVTDLTVIGSRTQVGHNNTT